MSASPRVALEHFVTGTVGRKREEMPEALEETTAGKERPLSTIGETVTTKG